MNWSLGGRSLGQRYARDNTWSIWNEFKKVKLTVQALRTFLFRRPSVKMSDEEAGADTLLNLRTETHCPFPDLSRCFQENVQHDFDDRDAGAENLDT